MAKKVLLLLGTKKGAFIMQSDEHRQNWDLRGPFCDVPIRDVKYEPATGAIYAAGAAKYGEEYKAGVWKTTDMGETWTHSAHDFTYGEGGPKIEKVWHLQPAHGSLYAGVDPAGLFRSDDGGETWQHVKGLREHPTCPDWGGGAGGLCLSSVVTNPHDPKEIWVGISSVGVWHTADGGETWEQRNGGMTQDYDPGQTYYSFCCHKFDRAPGEQTILYMQDHGGVYRSFDGGKNWESIAEGLPGDFGFPCAAHPHDPKKFYLIPVQDNGRFMAGGKAAVWRGDEHGSSYTRLSNGLPQEHAYFEVLREGLAVDNLPQHGIYFGTNNGFVFASNDEGENWQAIASHLPYVWAVNTAVIEE